MIYLTGMGFIENGCVCFSYLGDVKLNRVEQRALRKSEEPTPESIRDQTI
jgi:hypothetical protein